MVLLHEYACVPPEMEPDSPTPSQRHRRVRRDVAWVPMRMPRRGVIDLVLRSGPTAKIVLLILLVFSVVSWGIILHKSWYLRRVQTADGHVS